MFDTSSQWFQRQDDQEVDAHLFMFLSSPKQTVLDLNQEQQLTRHASLLKIIQTNLVCDIVR
jgi:hypothetical protein